MAFLATAAAIYDPLLDAEALCSPQNRYHLFVASQGRKALEQYPVARIPA
jgi:hypothetical protein